MSERIEMRRDRRNARIYKKWCKRAIELLKSYGQTHYDFCLDRQLYWLHNSEEEYLQRHFPHRMRQWERIDIPVHWYRCSYYEQEYDHYTALEAWLLEYENYKDGQWYDRFPPEFAYDQDKETVIHKTPRPPAMPSLNTLISTRMIGPGYRWRGGKAVRV